MMYTVSAEEPYWPQPLQHRHSVAAANPVGLWRWGACGACVVLLACAGLGAAAVPPPPSALHLPPPRPAQRVASPTHSALRGAAPPRPPAGHRVAEPVAGVTGLLLAQGLAYLPSHVPHHALLSDGSLWLALFAALGLGWAASHRRPPATLSLAFAGPSLGLAGEQPATRMPATQTRYAAESDRVSPFQSAPVAEGPAVAEDSEDGDPPDVLTEANVERVLNELRPYLIADGGNVELVEIDGPVVFLRLKGACGSCSSSAVTMTMGIKRRLKEAIPEIQDIVEVQEEKDPGLPLTEVNVEQVLSTEIRPFLTGAGGGDVQLAGIDGSTVQVSLQGPIKEIMTIRVAIVQKLRDSIPDIQTVRLV